MKSKTNLLIIVVMALALTFSACNSQNKKTDATEQTGTEKVVYTCPMHPEVISDKPGKCPKCGMELIKVEKVSDTTIVKK